jgi:hypothetical protein
LRKVIDAALEATVNRRIKPRSINLEIDPVSIM